MLEFDPENSVVVAAGFNGAPTKVRCGDCARTTGATPWTDDCRSGTMGGLALDLALDLDEDLLLTFIDSLCAIS